MLEVARARSRGWRAIYLNRITPVFWGLHLGAIAGVVWLGWSWSGLGLALGLYAVRLFFVTGGYHRYFAHRSYKTSRAMQAVLAFGAESTAQKGVLWWAWHHRLHHRESDGPDDLHSAKQYGFWWAHLGWILTRDFKGYDPAAVRDLARYPELRWLDRHWWVPVVAVAALTFAIGGWFGLVWGFAVSTVLAWHGTFTINSLSHLFGTRPYATGDDSRNNAALAILTLGEGWHNNHHHYQVATRQGFRWYQIDITFYVLRALAAVGLVWDLHGVPRHVLDGRTRGGTRATEPAPAPVAADSLDAAA
jgi:stearoyl-CoA desaturase (Delta-9 desaturase)